MEFTSVKKQQWSEIKEIIWKHFQNAKESPFFTAPVN